MILPEILNRKGYILVMDVKQLVSQMTLEEKAKFCSGADFWHVEGLERLGIPSVMVTDGPCGLRKPVLPEIPSHRNR